MNDLKKETYWSKFTSEFEEKQSHVVGSEILQRMHEELQEENKLGEVLELGCGTGLFTVSLQKISQHVTATDYSDEMVAVAQNKRGNLKNVIFQKANALDLEFPNETFDVVFMANLIHVIGDAEGVIKESKRVLKPGGSLLITSFAMNEMSFFSQMAMGIRYLKTFGKPSDDATKEKITRKSVENLLISNGFKITKSLMLGNKSKAFYISCIKI